MTAFHLGLAVLFANADLAKPATYYAGGVGAGVPIRVVVKSPDEIHEYGAARILVDTVVADILVSAVAGLSEGDHVEFGAVRYAVQGAPRRDALRLIWTAELVPA